MDEWVREDAPPSPGRTRGPRRPVPPAPSAGGGAARAASATPPPRLPSEVASEIRRAAQGLPARRREVLVDRMEKAVGAYERGRYGDAARFGNELAREVPSVGAVRRLAGLSAYRLERWRDAVRHLNAYVAATDETDAVPALMDSQRALGRHARVAETWAELRHRSPDADVVSEARIVAAGSLADRGDLAGAIELLTSAGAARRLRNPSDRHLRQWYSLADLYERAGDVPVARELFSRVALADPEAYDVTERLDALGPQRTPRGPRRGGRSAKAPGQRAASPRGATTGKRPRKSPGESPEDKGGARPA